MTKEFVSPIKLEFEKVYWPYLLMNKKRCEKGKGHSMELSIGNTTRSTTRPRPLPRGCGLGVVFGVSKVRGALLDQPRLLGPYGHQGYRGKDTQT